MIDDRLHCIRIVGLSIDVLDGFRGDFSLSSSWTVSFIKETVKVWEAS